MYVYLWYAVFEGFVHFGVEGKHVTIVLRETERLTRTLPASRLHSTAGAPVTNVEDQ